LVRFINSVKSVKSRQYHGSAKINTGGEEGIKSPMENW
jgi:hypothetical protein